MISTNLRSPHTQNFSRCCACKHVLLQQRHVACFAFVFQSRTGKSQLNRMWYRMWAQQWRLVLLSMMDGGGAAEERMGGSDIDICIYIQTFVVHQLDAAKRNNAKCPRFMPHESLMFTGEHSQRFSKNFALRFLTIQQHHTNCHHSMWHDEFSSTSCNLCCPSRQWPSCKQYCWRWKISLFSLFSL